MAWTRRIVSLVVVAVLVAGGGYLVQRRLLAGQRPTVPIYATAETFVGTMTAHVVDFGPLQPVYLSILKTAAGGTVIKVVVQAGQHVSKGATIELPSNPSLAAKIAQDQAKLAHLKNSDRVHVTVLGYTAYRELFGPADPIAQDVRLGDAAFRVIGILRALGGGGFGTGPVATFGSGSGSGSASGSAAGSSSGADGTSGSATAASGSGAPSAAGSSGAAGSGGSGGASAPTPQSTLPLARASTVTSWCPRPPRNC